MERERERERVTRGTSPRRIFADFHTRGSFNKRMEDYYLAQIIARDKFAVGWRIKCDYQRPG